MIGTTKTLAALWRLEQGLYNELSDRLEQAESDPNAQPDEISDGQSIYYPENHAPELDDAITYLHQLIDAYLRYCSPDTIIRARPLIHPNLSTGD